MHVGLYDPCWRGHHTVYARLVCRYLLERGHEVTFCTSTQHDCLSVFPDHSNFSVKRISGADPEQSGMVRSQLTEVRRFRRASGVLSDVDVVHHLCLDYVEVPFRLGSLARSLPPIVATVHRDHFNAKPDGPVDQFTKISVRRALNGAVRTGVVDQIFVHADTINDRLIQSLPAVSSSTVITVPCPTPDQSRNIDSETARTELDLPQDVPMLLFFGGLRSQKGPDILATAVEGLEEDVCIVFAGPEADFDGESVDRWADRSAESVTVCNRVGFIPETEIETYFRAVDALVLPYRRSRGISGPLRRACQTETHIIGCDDSDIGELIMTHNLGQTFTRGSPQALRDTISTYLANRDQYPTDAVAAYGRSQHWCAAGRAFENQYGRIFESYHQS